MRFFIIMQAAAAFSLAESQRRPNILLLTTDQQRTDTLGCFGSSFARSPNIDRLAAEGVRFTEAFTASPVCMSAQPHSTRGISASACA